MTVAMILAAGRGKRMRPLTDHTPKPLLAVGGKPLIEHHIEKLAAAGCERIVINLAYLGKQIRTHLGSGERFGVELLFSDEGESGLETAGGIRKALPLLGDAPFWLVNGDVWTDFDFCQLPCELAAGDLGHLMMVANPEHNPHGDFVLDQGRLKHEGEHKLTYSGVALLAPALVAELPIGVAPLAPLLKHAMAKGRIAGSQLNARWCDVGTPERLMQLNQSLK